MQLLLHVQIVDDTTFNSRCFQIRPGRKAVSGQSVDRESDVKVEEPRPLRKINPDYHPSRESEYVDIDQLRIEVRLK